MVILAPSFPFPMAYKKNKMIYAKRKPDTDLDPDQMLFPDSKSFLTIESQILSVPTREGHWIRKDRTDRSIEIPPTENIWSPAGLCTRGYLRLSVETCRALLRPEQRRVAPSEGKGSQSSSATAALEQ